MDETLYEELWLTFRNLGKDALSMNHYDLAENTTIDAATWKLFLQISEVAEWIASENRILQNSELQKLVKDASKSRSTGQAQLMMGLSKLNAETSTKTGDIFIYSYVPLSAQQEHAPNTRSEKKDIFIKRKEE